MQSYKCVCDFLLVRHSNLGPILHRFSDIACFFCSWPHPYFTPILGCSSFPLDQIARVGVSPSRNLKLISRESSFEVFQPVWKTYLNVTDGQTNRRMDGRTDDILWHKGQNPLHQFPCGKSVTSWRGQKSVVSVVSCRFRVPNSITTTCCQFVADLLLTCWPCR